MKVLIFTHRSDIDGMGGVVLAKLAFDEVDYVLCESLNLQDRMWGYFDSGAIYKYDRVFVTDMWLEEPMLSRLADDARLNNKFLLFDHHESALERGFNKYSFTTIRISDKKGLCSGTSLFYEYLIKNGLIDARAQTISEFVELTRRHDTWEWKTKYHDVQEASDTDAEEKNYCVKLDFEWQFSVFTVQHIFKSKHGFTTPFHLEY